MEREIAHVMAVCGMRGIRYISFPPIVFETPVPAPMSAEPEVLDEPEAVPAPAMLAEAIPAEAPVAAPLPPAFAAPPVEPRPAMSVAAALPPGDVAPSSRPVSPGLRRLAEFAATTDEGLAPQYQTRPAGKLAAAPLTNPSAHHAPPPERGDAPPPSFALLQDLAGEVRPRRVRARTGRSTADKTV